jgi:DNA-binding transcriptional MocR family regulator
MYTQAISAYLETCDWLGQIADYQAVYAARAQAMLSALAEHLPECRWTVPKGGFYTWVTLPEGLDARAMLPRATTALVAYVSGTAFYADGQGTGNMRLSFCYPSPERIREGVRRLAGVVNSELELVSLFGPQAAQRDKDVENPAPDLA